MPILLISINFHGDMMYKNILVLLIILTSNFVHANATIRPAIDSVINNLKVSQAVQGFNANVQNDGIACAQTDSYDPNGRPDTLGSTQAQILKDQSAIAKSTIDFDKYYSLASDGGCFDVIKNMPDLSVSIPALSDFTAAIEKTLQNYAQRKVCGAINSALESTLGSLTNKLNNLSNSGQLDLTGRVNRTISQKAYSIDNTLGQAQSSNQANTSYQFSW